MTRVLLISGRRVGLDKMTKIVYPKATGILICEKCGSQIPMEMASAEDGDIDFYWCESCMDYVDGTYGE